MFYLYIQHNADRQEYPFPEEIALMAWHILVFAAYCERCRAWLEWRKNDDALQSISSHFLGEG